MNIGVHADPLANGAMGVEDRDASRRGPAEDAIMAADPVMRGVGGVTGDGVGPGFRGGSSIVRINRVEPTVPLPLVEGLAGEGAPGGGVGFDDAVGLGRPDDLRAGLDEGPEALFALFEPSLGSPGFGHVAEDEDRADDLALARADRRCTVVDRPFRTVPGDQNGVIRQADDHPVAERAGGGILDDLARSLVNDPEHIGERPPLGVGLGPAGQALRDGIEERDAALGVGRDHGVANAAERHAEPFRLPVETFLRAPSFDADGDLVGHRTHHHQRRAGELVAGEHRQHANHAVLDDQGIAGETDHPLANRPRLLGHPRVAHDPVRQVGRPLRGDLADLELADRDPGMGAINMRIEAGAGAELEAFGVVLESPDPGEGASQVPDRGLGAAAEHRVEGRLDLDRSNDVASIFSQPELFGERSLGPRPIGDLPFQLATRRPPEFAKNHDRPADTHEEHQAEEIVGIPDQDRPARMKQEIGRGEDGQHQRQERRPQPAHGGRDHDGQKEEEVRQLGAEKVVEPQAGRGGGRHPQRGQTVSDDDRGKPIAGGRRLNHGRPLEPRLHPAGPP